MKRSFSLLYQHCGISFHPAGFCPFYPFSSEAQRPKDSPFSVCLSIQTNVDPSQLLLTPVGLANGTAVEKDKCTLSPVVNVDSLEISIQSGLIRSFYAPPSECPIALILVREDMRGEERKNQRR